MFFLVLIAFDARPVGVLIIAILVVLVMSLQYIVYGAQQFARFASDICRAGVVIKISQSFRGLVGGGYY
jgi:hypothetical protein